MEKQYNHLQHEADAQAFWEQNKIYAFDPARGQRFTIDTPPPTVSGSLHIGHIFSYTHADIIARYKRLQGFNVFYPMGFDDNGLATERFVEKTANVRAHTMPRTDFINLCLTETQKAEVQFKALWQRIALSIDWDYHYSTISPASRKIAQESFIRLYEKGHIYRKNEPAPYCTACRTSVAQAELDDVQRSSFFNDIIFKDHKGNDLVIGTTRPELLPSCVAVFYHPADTRYQHLNGTKAIVPVFGHEVTILPDEHVAIDKGTGLVMCCTFGDKMDIAWFKAHNLPYRPSFGRDGIWDASTGVMAGLKVEKAREAIINELRAQGLLIRQAPIEHSVNIHERCKHDIEYLSLSQWFMNILDHKTTFIELADTITWYPAFMKSRYINWVENLGWDWCLSRQRFYGIPFPVWHCVACDKMVFASFASLPVDPQETACPQKCLSCKGECVPDTDVMDTWNTSSLTPYICADLLNKSESVFTDERTKTFLPMSMRPQAHDIIRTWAFYTIIKSWMHNGVMPWDTIVISGHVLSDTKGKISKSQGGAKLTPEHLLATYSADAIRYWTASANLGYDCAFSENQLKIGNRLITKLWNAFRFIQEHTVDVDLAIEPAIKGAANEWLLHSATVCWQGYEKALEMQEFGVALDRVEKFFWADFCDMYLELVKDQLFNPGNYPAETVAATRWTLAHVGLRILQLYAPYIPHLCETLYRELYSKQGLPISINKTTYDAVQRAYVFEESAKTMIAINRIITHVRRLKTEKQLSLKVPLATLSIYESDSDTLYLIKAQEQLVRGITHAAVMHYHANELEAESIVADGEIWHMHVNLRQDA